MTIITFKRHQKPQLKTCFFWQSLTLVAQGFTNVIWFVPRATKPGIPTLVRAKKGLLEILEIAQVTVNQGWFDLFVSDVPSTHR